VRGDPKLLSELHGKHFDEPCTLDSLYGLGLVLCPADLGSGVRGLAPLLVRCFRRRPRGLAFCDRLRCLTRPS
jgi:hypothetical protein